MDNGDSDSKQASDSDTYDTVVSSRLIQMYHAEVQGELIDNTGLLSPSTLRRRFSTN